MCFHLVLVKQSDTKLASKHPLTEADVRFVIVVVQDRALTGAEAFNCPDDVGVLFSPSFLSHSI